MSNFKQSDRDVLIERIRKLPDEKLAQLKKFVTALECDGSASLSIAASAPIQRGAEPPHSIDWPHAPVHRLSEYGTYIVTAGTLHKQLLFHTKPRLDLVQGKLLSLSKHYGWQLEAWAVFSNHYHFVAHSRPGSEDLKVFLTHLHSDTAREINQLDKKPGRTVWYNFWDTQLTYERSYLARLNYVHQNAVRHRLVRVANQYPWCSAAWFERTASPAQVKTIYSFKTDKVNVYDEFPVCAILECDGLASLSMAMNDRPAEGR